MKSELIDPLKKERKKFEQQNDDLKKEIGNLDDKIYENEQEAEKAKDDILEKNKEFEAELKQKRETLRCNTKLINEINDLLRTYDSIEVTEG